MAEIDALSENCKISAGAFQPDQTSLIVWIVEYAATGLR
jgi:hypothetical protein